MLITAHSSSAEDRQLLKRHFNSVDEVFVKLKGIKVGFETELLLSLNCEKENISDPG